MVKLFGFGKDAEEEKQKVVRLEFDNGYSLNVNLDQLPFTIGRAADCDLVVSSEHVSRTHCTIESVDDEIHIVDQSTNGTFVDDLQLKHSSAPISTQMHLLFGGEFMLTLTPYDEDGAPIVHKKAAASGDETQQLLHGVCLVDICDSTEKTPEEVGNITKYLRIKMLKKNSNKLLLIKNTGDGFLLVYEDAASALETAVAVLDYQQEHGPEFGFDLRATIDAGMTSLTADKDRLGVAINRAARLEKTQAVNIEERGADFEALKARNRLILTEDMRNTMHPEDSEACEHIGSCKLKGFGDQMHDIYQYPV